MTPHLSLKKKKNSKEHLKSKVRIPDEFSISVKKSTSPLNAPVWRFSLFVTGGCLLAWLIRLIFGFNHPLSIWMIGLISLASWMAAIRLLFFDARLKKFWIVWLALGFLLLLFFGDEKGIWIASVSFSFVFLLFRRYKPYRHLTSRRRAALFLIGLFILSLLTLGFPYRQIVDQSQPKTQTFVQPENFSLLVSLELNNLTAFGLNMTYYALGSLQLFWFFSLLHLFFGIRLHFMKLRPKLAVSAVLIAVVPLSLVIIMGILTLYSTLGESRASRLFRPK